jgi:hypothetical protein
MPWRKLFFRRLWRRSTTARSFEEAARRALEEWHEAHPETERELHRIEKRIEQRRKAIDRYLRAFEAGRLSEETCGYRIREIEKELATLEAEAGALESESDLAPSSPSAALLSDLRTRVGEAVAASAPEQIKELLAAVVSRIVVESRASIQPYFVAPAVRTLLPSRRRRLQRTNPGGPGPALWVDTHSWGRVA